MARPQTVTPQAVEAARRAVENSMLSIRCYGGSTTDYDTDMRSALEAAEPYMLFAPTGDNHHNGLLCPYCSPPDRVTFQLEPERAKRLLELMQKAAFPERLGSYEDAADMQALEFDIRMMVER